MNNIQELYKTQRFLIALKQNRITNYSKMIEVDENKEEVRITLSEELCKNLKADEKKEVLRMIYNDLRGQDNRKKIEEMVIAEVGEQLEKCKKRIREDIGVKDILEEKDTSLSDPRD